MKQKRQRETKRQLGQFMTPIDLSERLLKSIEIKKGDYILEPSCGDGSFVVSILKKIAPLYNSLHEALNYVYAVELDPELYKKCIENVSLLCGFVPTNFNIRNNDFFDVHFPMKFDFIIGNPPFGGTVNNDINREDELDKLYGKRLGEKIKKETYSFFSIKCLDEHLKKEGSLYFICSDTFMSINTHKGLRKYFLQYDTKISALSYFSEDTSYPMVWIECDKGKKSALMVNNNLIDINNVLSTPNYSFNITNEYAKYFKGKLLKSFITGSSGMTIGNNDLFLREEKDGKIIEKYKFSIESVTMTLDDEIKKSRGGRISKTTRDSIGIKKIDKLIMEEIPPIEITINNNYMPYNKMNTEDDIIVKPRTYIYWGKEGKEVYSFKKTGNWYLHGIGGKKFFFREGITWNLINSNFNPLYLPSGFVLDSGRPCIFLNNNIEKDELYFIYAWLHSALCLKLLKGVINHTRNIQSKDIERLPYYESERKEEIILLTKNFIEAKVSKKDFKNVINSVFI